MNYFNPRFQTFTVEEILIFFGFGVLHGVWVKLVDDVSETAVVPSSLVMSTEDKCTKNQNSFKFQ